jgi:hypothetical protein
VRISIIPVRMWVGSPRHQQPTIHRTSACHLRQHAARCRAWPTGSARRAGVRIDGGRRGRRGDGGELISAIRVDVVLARGRRRRRGRRRAGGGGARGRAWCRRGRGVSGLVSPTARSHCAQRDDDDRPGDHARVASRRRWRHDSILSVADDRQQRRQVATGRGAAPSRLQPICAVRGRARNSRPRSVLTAGTCPKEPHSHFRASGGLLASRG